MIHFEPYFTNLQITSKCNLSCKQCNSNGRNHRGKELSFVEIIDVVNELYYLNCKKIQISGGEPLLREDVFEIATYISSLGIETQILSNGFLIDEEVVAKLKKAGVSCVGISIDGLAETHNNLRSNPEAFEKAINALKLLVENDIKTNVLTTVCNLPLNEFDSMYAKLRDIKVNNWIIQTSACVGRMKQFNEFALESKDLLVLKEFIPKNQNINGLNVVTGDTIGYYSEIESKTKNGKSFSCCYAGIFQMGILSDGNVVGCLAMPHTKKYFEGNIREKSLSNIWFDKNSFCYNRKITQSINKSCSKKYKYGSVCDAGL